MCSSRLDKYGDQIKRVTAASAREEQRKVLRESRFRASLVDNPLKPANDIVRAIEIARYRTS